MWVLGQSLRDVHEYEADDHVLRSGVSIDDYRRLLIQKAVGNSPYLFANSFNHSLLKKRIGMMCRRKSSPWLRAKALYMVPVALLALSFFATPEFAKAGDLIVRAIEERVCYIVDGETVDEESLSSLKSEMIHDITVIKQMEKLAGIVPQGKGYTSAVILNTIALNDVEVRASFPGGEEAMSRWISSHLRYPAEALEWRQTGRITVSFVVEKEGRITHVAGSDDEAGLPANHPAGTIAAARKALVGEAERLVREMPRWSPAQDKGEPVRMNMALPITFDLIK